MGTLDLTVEVLNLPPTATPADLSTFFFYCGTIDKIQLWRFEDQTQLALVTFKQPYALKTALLLDGAFIGGSKVCILPLRRSEYLLNIPIDTSNPANMNREPQNEKPCNIIASVQSVAQTMIAKGHEAVGKAKELDEKYGMVEKGRVFGEQTKLAAERLAGCLGSAILNSDHVAEGAFWLSGVLDKAAKHTFDIGKKAKESNLRKLK